jgi:hypothetical protein
MKLSTFFEYVNGPGDDESERIVTLKDGAPTWLRDAVYACHDGTLPDNWVYETCYAVACSLDERDKGDSVEDWLASELHNFADSQVDIYTKSIYQWATDHVGSSLYCAAEDAADGEYESTEQKFQAIQYWAIDSIASTFANAVVEAETEEDDNPISRAQA